MRRLSPLDIYALSRESVIDWLDDRSPRKAAALAFYTLFSLAPILIIAINVAALAFGEQAARGEVVSQIGGLVGESGALAVQALIDDAAKTEGGGWATVIGIVTLLVGATSAFAELKDGLDQIWRVPPERTSGFGYLVRQRLLSFGLILTVGFLLLVSLVFSAALEAFGRYFGASLAPALLELVNSVLSFVLVVTLFASIYKLLPSVRIAWRDVFAGAVVTSLLFTAGKYLIGLYLGGSAIASSYGAAGSIIIVMMWVYFSAMIFLLGAEFTRVFTYRHGSRRHAPEAAQALTQPVDQPATQ